jgi:hypothetical protein
MINSNALRSSMAFRGQAAPAVSATQEYQVLFGALVAFLIGSGAVVLHALSAIGS